MRHDPSIQFNLAPSEPPAKAPAWLDALLHWVAKLLEPIGDLLEGIARLLPDAAYARILLWIVIAAGVAAFIWALFNRIRYGKWAFMLPRPSFVADVPPVEEDWTLEEAEARSWLEEADALAAEGRFAEAIHHLLLRSIEDLARRRPALVQPALTSRELAASQAIPERARELFSSIAGLVEQSLFGGRPVDQSNWNRARKSYSEFALARAWRA